MARNIDSVDRIIYTARWILPVCQPPLARGTITVAGERIESVNPHGEHAADIDLGNAAIIPGLANAHTHLDLSGARGQIPPTDPEHFTDWLLGVIAYRRSRTPEQVQQDIHDGLAEALQYGTTLIGDITVGGLSYPAVANAKLRSVLFWEMIGLTQERLNTNLSEFAKIAGLDWIDDSTHPVYRDTQTCHWMGSPHSPYSVLHDHAVSFMAFSGGAIHLAESPAEMEFLDKGRGPIVEFLKRLNVWEPSAFRHSLSDFLRTFPTKFEKQQLYIHCNYLPLNAELGPSQTIVFCPRTHAAFGHPPHPFAEFQKRGVNVALGTDSLASNPDLDLLAEAKCLRERYPEVPGETILRMATLNGAKALGYAKECGTLEAGKSADFVVLPLANEEGDPHDLAFASQGPRQTLFRGEWRHFL